MTQTIHTRIATVIALVAALVPWVGNAPALAAEPVLHTTTTTSLTDFHQLVLDEAHGHLFLRTTGAILVADLAGNEVRYLNNVAGDSQMTLSEDGAILWVPLGDQARILRINTADLRKDGTINLPNSVCPYAVAETNGLLAVTHGCEEGPVYGIGVIDLADETWTDSTDRDPPRLNSIVASSPGAPGLVVTLEKTSQVHRVRTYDVSTSEPTLLAERELSEYSWAPDIAITPDGSAVLVASGNPDRLFRFNLPDLSGNRTYKIHHNGDEGRAAAWSSDGNVLVAGTNGRFEVGVYKQGANAPKVVHTVRGSTAARGIATDATGKYIWLVTESGGGAFLLHVLPGFGWGKCKGRFPNFVGTDGDDVIEGTDYDDVIVGGAGNDQIDATFGDDVICGQAGDDLIHPGQGDDIAHGGGGRDTVTFAVHSGAVEVDLTARAATGGQGDDVLQNFENVIGSKSPDVIIGNGKANVIHGGDGDDAIAGLGKADTIYGEGWSDYIEGGPGNDTIYGGDDNDLLIGNQGNDTLLGQDHDDTLAGMEGDDILKGGAGDDTASFALSTNGVTASLLTKTATGEGSDTLNAIEWIVGTEHDDHLTGNGSMNLLESRGGDDRLYGDGNDDVLAGGAGYDVLNGGTGSDACYDGESHTSCELIDTTANVVEIPWSLDVIGSAVVFLPRIRLE